MLKIGGWLFLLMAFGFALMSHGLMAKDPRLGINLFALTVLVLFPTALCVLMLGQANARQDPYGRWGFGASFSDRVVAFVSSLNLILSFHAVYSLLSPTPRLVLLILIVWVGASYYYFRVLDGWSSIQPRTQRRILETLGLIFYGVFRVIFEIVVNVIFLALTGGRSGLIGFGGGKSGGGGASGKW